ncbi:MAG: hypothetical protein ACRYG5_02405 [Janthinobacterium lividum]
MTTPVLRFEPIPPKHPAAIELGRLTGAQSAPVSVQYRPLAQIGMCYWNVESHIRESGGQMVLGWLLSWWPDLYAQAMHHAVWQQPGGELVDISRGYSRYAGFATTTFVEDASQPVDLSVGIMPESLFLALDGDRLVSDKVAASRELTKLDRLVAIERANCGVRHDVPFHGTISPALQAIADRRELVRNKNDATLVELMKWDDRGRRP